MAMLAPAPGCLLRIVPALPARLSLCRWTWGGSQFGPRQPLLAPCAGMPPPPVEDAFRAAVVDLPVAGSVVDGDRVAPHRIGRSQPLQRPVSFGCVPVPPLQLAGGG